MQGCLGIWSFLAGVLKDFFGLLNQLAPTIIYWQLASHGYLLERYIIRRVSSESRSRQLHTSKTVLLALKYNVSLSLVSDQVYWVCLYAACRVWATCQVTCVLCPYVRAWDRGGESERELVFVQYSLFSNPSLLWNWSCEEKKASPWSHPSLMTMHVVITSLAQDPRLGINCNWSGGCTLTGWSHAWASLLASLPVTRMNLLPQVWIIGLYCTWIVTLHAKLVLTQLAYLAETETIQALWMVMPLS